MSDLLSNPKHWRDRAEEARAHAAEMDDEGARATMYEIARGYDQLAEKAAARAKAAKLSQA